MFTEPVYLTDAELFQDLTSEEMDALSEQMPMREVEAETVFYSPEKPIEELTFIKKGTHPFILSFGGRENFYDGDTRGGNFFRRNDDPRAEPLRKIRRSRHALHFVRDESR